MRINEYSNRMPSREIVRFLVVGILNTAFSYSIYALSIWIGLAYYSASFVGLIIGIAFSFKTQGAIVFRNSDNSLIFLFTLNWLLIYACMVGVIALFMRFGLNDYWAGLLALPPVAVFSYFSQKFLVFRTGGQHRTSSRDVARKQPSIPLILYIKNYPHFARRLLVRNGFGKVQFGIESYGAPTIRWWGERANLCVGKYCSISKNVEIFLGGNHRIDWVTTYPFPAFSRWVSEVHHEGYVLSKGDVIIGNDVWLGQGCVIMSGVKIGNGAVVGAYAVVSKDIPDYAIAIGNPARVIRRRHSDAQVQALNAIAWWDWDTTKVKENIGVLLSGDVEEFIRLHQELDRKLDTRS